ncbi:MAG TPA: hypothetical protein VK886_15775 [Vicinamibacterales bacterium]|nr:hypothetical protein [Vicinamibacterales bacterium]
MNFSRLTLAAVVAWVAFSVIGFVAHGVLMDDLYATHREILRSDADANARLPLAFAVSLVGFFAFAYAYAKGYEGGSGAHEGLRFGVLVGVMLIAFVTIWDYMMFPLSRTFLLAMVIDYIVEFAIYGTIVGAIYRPRTR